MGVGGKFWELLKPYARFEGFDFLRDKKVAIDLSYWIVQHETAIRIEAFNPHLRLTFFHTVNFFSKFGVFPVFVLDGTPSPLKSHARMGSVFPALILQLRMWPKRVFPRRETRHSQNMLITVWSCLNYWECLC